jgi:hypothetical protein
VTAAPTTRAATSATRVFPRAMKAMIAVGGGEVVQRAGLARRQGVTAIVTGGAAHVPSAAVVCTAATAS